VSELTLHGASTFVTVAEVPQSHHVVLHGGIPSPAVTQTATVLQGAGDAGLRLFVPEP
jgi:hypothetical protein